VSDTCIKHSVPVIIYILSAGHKIWFKELARKFGDFRRGVG
jgi:hypothetical protein